LMCDINQRWRPEQAIDIGRRVEDAGVGLFWLEDVTTADDFPGLARVSDALSTPVAGGEYVWGIVPFRHMMEQRSVDVPMIDLVRVGGITQWLKVAGMAEAFNLPIVSHLIPEVHVHLIGAVPNGLTVEYMPRLFPLWKEVPQPVDGDLLMPTAPGLGLEFDQAAIEKYRVVCVLVGLVVFLSMLAILNRTRIGLLIRAGVENTEMVEALGYRITRLFVGVFMAGSALAGLGGVMWGLYREQVNAAMGGELLVLVFIVVIIGGLGSVTGCFIGALLVALATNYAGFLVPKAALITDILLMVVILLWRPRGLYPVTSR